MSAEEAVAKARLMAAKRLESETFRSAYDLCKEVLIEDGWNEKEIDELAAILKVDLDDGAGVDRPFPMPKSERRECWLNWMLERSKKNNPQAGATDRIRAGNGAEKNNGSV